MIQASVCCTQQQHHGIFMVFHGVSSCCSSSEVVTPPLDLGQVQLGHMHGEPSWRWSVCPSEHHLCLNKHLTSLFWPYIMCISIWYTMYISEKGCFPDVLHPATSQKTITDGKICQKAIKSQGNTQRFNTFPLPIPTSWLRCCLTSLSAPQYRISSSCAGCQMPNGIRFVSNGFFTEGPYSFPINSEK